MEIMEKTKNGNDGILAQQGQALTLEHQHRARKTTIIVVFDIGQGCAGLARKPGSAI